MCGIAGLINFENSRDCIETIHNLQKHRGPDSTGLWSNSENVWLAHQRLSIIDISERSNQPFAKDGLVIVFNGEIYNYKLIRNRLQTEHQVKFFTDGDTEVILEAYRHWKCSCFNEFIGMFAFAIYDLEKHELIIARDHFGIKPLFYTNFRNKFAFSSELKCLVSLPGFERNLNSFSFLSSLNYLWVSGNESMFNNTLKLRPGHYIKINTAKDINDINEIQYWSLQPKIENRSESEWCELLNYQLRQTIDRHMVSDVPVSSFLSGGLDSSIISVLASERTNNLSTFTIATDKRDKMVEQMPEDERYAAKVARQFGFDHHEIVIKPNILNELPFMVRTLDEPIGDPAALNTYLICKNARSMGVKVLLSGMGADEIFMGYRRQQATIMVSKYQKLPIWLRSVIRSGANKLPVKFRNKGLKLSRWAKRFTSFADLPLEKAYRRSFSYYDDQEYEQLLTAAYSREIDGLNEQHHSYYYGQKNLDIENRMCFTDIHMFMLGLNLTYTDRASMAASVEVRVPFIDRPMIELAMSIPGNLKFKGGEGKYILKKAAENFLPHDIIYRPKASFGAPIRSWISGELKPMIDDLLGEESVRRRNLFNYEYIKKMIDLDRNGKIDYAYQIYQLITIELWLREYYDR